MFWQSLTVFAADDPLGPGPAGVIQLQQLITRMINLSVEFGFIALTFMLIVGGLKYLTSGGDAKNVQSAQQTITWALLGILFLVLAIVILRIISVFTGVDLLHFSISFPGGYTSPNERCLNGLGSGGACQ